MTAEEVLLGSQNYQFINVHILCRNCIIEKIIQSLQVDIFLEYVSMFSCNHNVNGITFEYIIEIFLLYPVRRDSFLI